MVVGWAIVGTLDDGEDAVLVAGPPYALWRTLIGLTVAVSVATTLFTVPLFVELRSRYPSASLLTVNIIFIVAIVLTASFR